MANLLAVPVWGGGGAALFCCCCGGDGGEEKAAGCTVKTFSRPIMDLIVQSCCRSLHFIDTPIRTCVNLISLSLAFVLTTVKAKLSLFTASHSTSLVKPTTEIENCDIEGTENKRSSVTSWILE